MENERKRRVSRANRQVLGQEAEVGTRLQAVALRHQATTRHKAAAVGAPAPARGTSRQPCVRSHGHAHTHPPPGQEQVCTSHPLWESRSFYLSPRQSRAREPSILPPPSHTCCQSRKPPRLRSEDNPLPSAANSLTETEVTQGREYFGMCLFPGHFRIYKGTGLKYSTG